VCVRVRMAAMIQACVCHAEDGCSIQRECADGPP
jgi:hypothetical protein